MVVEVKTVATEMMMMVMVVMMMVAMVTMLETKVTMMAALARLQCDKKVNQWEKPGAIGLRARWRR